MTPNLWTVVYNSVSQPFLSCVPPEPICHTMSTPMLMILKKYNVTQVIIKCFHVPPAVCLRTPRGTRTPGWESLVYNIKHIIYSVEQWTKRHPCKEHVYLWCPYKDIKVTQYGMTKCLRFQLFSLFIWLQLHLFDLGCTRNCRLQIFS